MARIKPFRGMVYNQDFIRDMASVVSPPYDVIPAALQEELYRSHPNNIVRLILNKTRGADTDTDNRYTRAAKLLNEWSSEGLLSEDGEKCVYVYSQRYISGEKSIDRVGFIGLMELGASTRVLPHENTLASPRADRLELTRKTLACLEPIFVLYDDPAHRITGLLKSFLKKRRPFIDIEYDGVRNKVWRMDDAETISRITSIMAGKDIFIADGHHRYETACNFHKEALGSSMPDSVKENSGYIMAYFTESDEKTLTIFPAHRVVIDANGLDENVILDRLIPFFVIRPAASLKSIMTAITRVSGHHAFGMYVGGRYYMLKLKDPGCSDSVIAGRSRDWKRLDVSILHLFIFQKVLGLSDGDDNVNFFKDPAAAAGSVDSGKGKIAFFLNPTRVSQVKRIAKLGEKMPRKATYFYPKPLSGLVMYKF